jgi:hypothetical protein
MVIFNSYVKLPEGSHYDEFVAIKPAVHFGRLHVSPLMDLKHRWFVKATSPAALQKGTQMEPWPRESGGKSPRKSDGILWWFNGI